MVAVVAEAAAWLRDEACGHYPDSELARKRAVRISTS
jgi:hypothetical protein